MLAPRSIQIVGQEVAIAWSDGEESYFTFAKLRAASPSAENQGEPDLFGNRHGGVTGHRDYSKVEVRGWEQIGNYAIRFDFSDGHKSGLYSYEYLRDLARYP